MLRLRLGQSSVHCYGKWKRRVVLIDLLYYCILLSSLTHLFVANVFVFTGVAVKVKNPEDDPVGVDSYLKSTLSRSNTV